MEKKSIILISTRHLIIFLFFIIVSEARGMLHKHHHSKKDDDDSLLLVPHIPQQQNYSKLSPRRAVDIDIQVATNNPNHEEDYEFDNDHMTTLRTQKKKKKVPKVLHMKPAYPCDEWQARTRTCWLDRNIGETVTFVLSFNDGQSPDVEWSQVFHVLGGGTKSYIIQSEFSPWNIVIGSRGHEMRISPITEIDIDNNAFSAMIPGKQSSLNFKIRILPLNLGYVYPGETLMFNMKRVNLPSKAMTYVWHLEKDGENGSLPSNMKLSPGGEVIAVAELRKEQTGILACSVYTNQRLFATKIRYRIDDITESDNMLMFTQTRPPHHVIKQRKKRELSIDNLQDDQETLTTTYLDNILIDDDSIRDPYNEVPLSRKKRQIRDDFHNSKNNFRNKGQYSSDGNQETLNTVDETQNLNPEMQDPDQLSYNSVQNSGYEGNNMEENTYTDGVDNLQNIYAREIMPANDINASVEEDSQISNSNPMLDDNSHRSNRQSNFNPFQNNLQPNFPISENQKSIISDNFAVSEKEKYERLLATCTIDSQCNNDAKCSVPEPNQPGYCTCIEGFHGNGIFCWKSIKA